MKYSFLLIYVFAFIITLQLTDSKVDVIYASGNDFEIILAAQEDDKDTKPYMSALLELKDEKSDAYVFTKKEMSAKEVEASPTEIPSLIVKQNGEVSGRVSGDHLTKQEILKRLKDILSN